MIPEGNTLDEIKERERIIREFYREWKEKNPLQRKYNLALKKDVRQHILLCIRPNCVKEVYTGV